MSKTIKIISILMVAIMVIAISTPVFAAGFDDALTDFEGTAPSGDEAGKAKNIAKSILGFLQWGAIIGGVIIITVLGIKYMMGSLEEKAQYKKSMVPLIVGVIVVVCATTITNLLFNTFSST